MRRESKESDVRLAGTGYAKRPVQQTRAIARVWFIGVARLFAPLFVGAQVGGFLRHPELEFFIRGHDKRVSSVVRFPFATAGQFDRESTAHHRHRFFLAGAELKFSDCHYADGGRQGCSLEGNGRHLAIEVLVYLEHFGSSINDKGWQSCQPLCRVLLFRSAASAALC